MEYLYEEEEYLGFYFCSICGWVTIENFPTCHDRENEEDLEEAIHLWGETVEDYY